MLWACDEPWWDKYFPLVSLNFPGELWTVSEAAREKYGLYWIYGADAGGLSRDPAVINTGKNGGFQAIHIAYLWGAARIVLLGYDFQATGGRSHWHGDHPPGLSNSRRRYANWRVPMEALAADLARTDCKVVNCSRASALTCFPRIELKEALSDDHQRHDRGRDDRSMPAVQHCALR